MSDARVIPVETFAFTMDRVLAYGTITGDMNPIHVDPEFAARSRFGAPIVHGLFILAPVWEAIEQALGRDAFEGAVAEISFVAPTYVGASPKYAVRLRQGGQLDIEVADQTGKVAVTASLAFCPCA